MVPLHAVQRDALSIALRHVRRRKKSAGSVMFITATTLALLAAMGVYALVASRQEMQVSGFMRQATQSHYLSEGSMEATAAFVNTGNAGMFVKTLAMGATQDKNCTTAAPYASITASQVAKACWRFSRPEIEQAWTLPGTLPPGPGGPVVADTAPGVTCVACDHGFGSPYITADVWAEFTNPIEIAPPPGFDLALGLKFARVTVSTGGITALSLAGMNAAQTQATRTPEFGRARLIVGPYR